MAQFKTSSFGNYYPADSVLHRLDPRVKIVLATIMMIVIFFLKDALSLGLYALGVLFLIVLSKVDLKTIWQTIKPILLITLIAFVLNLFTVPGESLVQLGPLSITYESLETALLMAVRLIFLVVSSALLLSLTTTTLLLSQAVESLLMPLAVFGFPVHDVSMMISIALRFIPTLAEEANNIAKAQSSRGANYDAGGFIQKLKGLITILIPLFVSAIKRAGDLATAMEARCYNGGEGRTRYKSLKLTASDVIFFILALLYVIFLLLIARGVF